MRKVAHIMGMPITVDIPECNDLEVFNAVFKRFKEIDNRYSPYKKQSELSKFNNGSISENDLSTEFQHIIAKCREATKATGGYFSAHYAGKYDPSGYVKGWSISEAAKLIEKSGYKTFCIGAGGDVLARSISDKTWNIGIQDPRNKNEFLAKISDKNFAVATSGNYERGFHIINPLTGEQADDLLSVTIVGPEIIIADIFATAVFAEGLSGLIKVEELEDYEALLIDKSGDFYMTSGMDNLLIFQ